VLKQVTIKNDPMNTNTCPTGSEPIRKKRYNKFTGELTYISDAITPPPEPPKQMDVLINLWDLGTTGLIDYVQGRSPWWPKDPMLCIHSTMQRRMRALVVIERRTNHDPRTRERFTKAFCSLLIRRVSR